MKWKNDWMFYVIIHVLTMGVWGALIEIPTNNGFPPTLGYVVWALTMVPASLIMLKLNGWKIRFDFNSMKWGLLAGILGAGGQLALFIVLKTAPAYIVFPIISLTPLVTILLAVMFLKERTKTIGWIGIIIALAAILLLSYQPPSSNGVQGYSWLLLTAIPLLAWGAQGFVMRLANENSPAEVIFFYMMIGSILLIPFALMMTDFSLPINWGFTGTWLTAMIQSLNAIGALCLVYAFRYGKAIIIAPMTTALSPVLTVALSLLIYAAWPHTAILSGIVLAVISAFLMAKGEVQA